MDRPDPVPVAVLDDYQRVARRCADWSLGGRVEVTAFDDHVEDEDALVHRLTPFPVVVAMRERTPFPRSLLARLPGLQLLITTGMANASFDLDAAAELGVTVCGTGGSEVSTAELTWALLQSLVRGVTPEDAGVRAGRWQLGLGPELAGGTLGVLGLGRIGTRIARYARAFDMDVLAWSPRLTDDAAEAGGARRVERHELFERSDVVSVHARLTPQSRGVVGRAELTALGPRGYLVNTSRGPLVDEFALVEALRDGLIAGAALDVFDVEPLPPHHPLRTTPNTLLSPHLGYVSRQNYGRYFTDAVEDIAQWLAGDPVRVLTG